MATEGKMRELALPWESWMGEAFSDYTLMSDAFSNMAWREDTSA